MIDQREQLAEQVQWFFEAIEAVIDWCEEHESKIWYVNPAECEAQRLLRLTGANPYEPCSIVPKLLVAPNTYSEVRLDLPFSRSNGTMLARIYERLTKASRRRQEDETEALGFRELTSRESFYRKGVYDAFKALQEELSE